MDAAQNKQILILCLGQIFLTSGIASGCYGHVRQTQSSVRLSRHLRQIRTKPSFSYGWVNSLESVLQFLPNVKFDRFQYLQ